MQNKNPLETSGGLFLLLSPTKDNSKGFWVA